MNWNDTWGIARCLNQNPDFTDLDLSNLTPENLENIIIENGYETQILPDGDLRTNTLNSILWHWMRLQDEGENNVREAG